MATNPNKKKPITVECSEWLEKLLRAGTIVKVPEIVDYELRRKLLHLDSLNGIARLNILKTQGYIPLTTEAILKAAELWADCRKTGISTAPEDGIDVDVILAAQAILFEEQYGESVIIATTNIGHLRRFTAADVWQNITPS